MADNYTRLPDAISAKEGTAYVTIDGQNRVLFEIVTLSASIEKSVIEKSMLGSRIKQHKVVGVTINGSMTVALMSGDNLRATIDYIKTGRYPQVDIYIKNQDKASTIGSREILLQNVITTTDLLAMIDVDSDEVITYDTDFTADGIEILKDFVRPSNYR